MAHDRILDKARSALVVIDVQEAFRDAIPDFATVVNQISIAARGFQTLGVPVLVTEQYPKGLGRTAEEILYALPDGAQVFEKAAFSSCGASPFVDQLTDLGVEQIVICGLETHICVSQTAHDLRDRGFQVHLLLDAVCSRFPVNKEAGIQKMASSGVIMSSVEMALFELMRDAKHEKFKEIQALIK